MFLLKIKIKKQNLLHSSKSQHYIKILINTIYILYKIKNKKNLAMLLIKELIQKNKLLKQFYYLKYFNNRLNFITINLALYFNSNFEQYLKKKTQNLVVYIINIYLTNTNTLINITDLKGNSKIYCSSGHLNFKGKQKIRQPRVIINILKVLMTKTQILKNKPIAIHFKNMKSHYESFIIKTIKNKFFIKIIKSFNLQPHNGCKLKKLKRFKRKKK